MPAGYRLRPARDEDVDAVVRLANAEAEELIGTRLMSAPLLLREWTSPDVDRERDIAVLDGPGGEVCGYLGVLSSPPYTRVFAIGIVALAHHGRGIGGALVDEAERRARRFLPLAPAGERVLLHIGALAGEPRVSALLAARGYREVRRFQLMRVDFDGPPAPPAGVAGVEIRAPRPDDERALYRAHRAAFADHWGEGEPTFEGFRHEALSGPEFDPGLWWLAWDGDELAGYLGALAVSEEDPRRGYVRLLGVRPEYRRRGIAEALLRTAFVELAARGKSGCDLHVDADSPTGATRLYARVGMRAHPRFATWETVMREGAARAGGTAGAGAR